MKHLFTLCILVCFCAWGRQAFAQEDFAQFRKRYTFERERFAGTNSSEPKRVELPFDTSTQRYDLTADLNKTLDYIPPKIRITKEIEKRKFEGWRVQIYRGRSREEANRAKKISYEMYPNLTAYMEYSAPTYRVRVGDFLDQSEYQSILKRFKRVFPTAISVPAIITIIVDNRDLIEEQEKEKRDKKDNKKEENDDK